MSGLRTYRRAHGHSQDHAVAAVTLIVSTALVMRAPPRLRPWSMLIGFLSGCVTAALLGVYDLERLYSAQWVGLPQVGFPGLDLTPGAGFWALLPMFLIVTLVQAIKGIGDNTVIQRVSRRRPRTTDFRLLQGSLYANGLGILLSGLAGTPPASPYSSFTASVVNMTGVAARHVGYAIAIILVAMALIPKLMGALLTIPSPVMGAFLLAALGIFFVEGVRRRSRGTGLMFRSPWLWACHSQSAPGCNSRTCLADLIGYIRGARCSATASRWAPQLRLRSRSS